MFKFARKPSQLIGGHPLAETVFLHIVWKYKPSEPVGDHPLWPCPLRVASNFVRHSYENRFAKKTFYWHTPKIAKLDIRVPILFTLSFSEFKGTHLRYTILHYLFQHLNNFLKSYFMAKDPLSSAQSPSWLITSRFEKWPNRPLICWAFGDSLGLCISSHIVLRHE